MVDKKPIDADGVGIASRLLNKGVAMQLQVEFVLPTGEQRVRTVTRVAPVSVDRVDVEASINGSVVALETLQRAAGLAHAGHYDQARIALVSMLVSKKLLSCCFCFDFD